MVIFHSYISLPEGSLPDDFRCKERIGPSYEKYAGQRLSHCSSAVKGAMVRFPKRNGEPGGSTMSFPTTWWMKAEDSLKNTISVCSWNFLKASCWVYRMEPYFLITIRVMSLWTENGIWLDKWPNGFFSWSIRCPSQYSCGFTSLRIVATLI